MQLLTLRTLAPAVARYVRSEFKVYTFHTHTHTHTHTHKYSVIHKSLRDFGPLRSVAGMVTPKGSMSTQAETLQFSLLPYRCSIRPPLVTRQCQSCNQVPATHIARVWQELDYRIDIHQGWTYRGPVT